MQNFADKATIYTFITSDVQDDDLRIIGGAPTYYYPISVDSIMQIASNIYLAFKKTSSANICIPKKSKPSKKHLLGLKMDQQFHYLWCS